MCVFKPCIGLHAFLKQIHFCLTVILLYNCDIQEVAKINSEKSPPPETETIDEHYEAPSPLLQLTKKQLDDYRKKANELRVCFCITCTASSKLGHILTHINCAETTSRSISLAVLVCSSGSSSSQY